MVGRVLVCLLAVSLVEAVLDGTKAFRDTRTHLKSSRGRVTFPNALLENVKVNGLSPQLTQNRPSARSKRDSGSCGFEASVELEVSPVSVLVGSVTDMLHSIASPLLCRWTWRKVQKPYKRCGLVEM